LGLDSIQLFGLGFSMFSHLNNLGCYIYSAINGWEVFYTPPVNGLKTFITSVSVPGIGIYFMNGDTSLLLEEESGQWKERPITGLTFRPRACSVQISPQRTAHIGGDSTDYGVSNEKPIDCMFLIYYIQLEHN
jgi:hypothetical protein